jgi:hypothetical protein
MLRFTRAHGCRPAAVWPNNILELTTVPRESGPHWPWRSTPTAALLIIGHVRIPSPSSLARVQFARRLLLHAAAALALLLLSLALGMAGYVYFDALPWRDAFLNAAMLLGGMGPVDAPHTPGGKLFAGCFALYAGLVFLVTAGLILSPMAHRLLHLFHWEPRR